MAGRLVRRPYVASAEPQTFRDNSVELCDDMGAAELSARPKATVIPEGTELDAVLAEVRRQASGRAARRLWLPPLDKYLSLETLQGRYGAYTPECKPWQLVLPIGELDDPGHQEKRPYAVSFEEDSNVAVYGASGSGRTELLATMLWSVLDESPDDRLAYVVDSEAGALLAFDGAPEVPNVLQVNDAERVSNLFKLMELEISKRQRLFGGEYTDLDAYNEKAPEGHHVPSILVAINGVAQFFELNPNLDERLSSIMRNGQRYGIHVLLAADAPNDIRFRLRSMISSSLVLMLASDDDYLAVLGSMRGVSLPKVRGRGLVRVGDEKLLFQTAFICEGAPAPMPKSRDEKLSSLNDGERRNIACRCCLRYSPRRRPQGSLRIRRSLGGCFPTTSPRYRSPSRSRRRSSLQRASRSNASRSCKAQQKSPMPKALPSSSSILWGPSDRPLGGQHRSLSIRREQPSRRQWVLASC